MKRLFILTITMILILSFLNPLLIYATPEYEKGTVRVSLEDYKNEGDFDHVTFCLAKIGTIEESIHEHMTESNILDYLENRETEYVCDLDVNGVAEFTSLEDGTYLLYGRSDDTSVEIEPALLTVPFYDVISGKMKYKVDIFPKYQRIETEQASVPVTGDKMKVEGYLASIVLSFMMISALSIFLYKRYKRSR